MLGTGYLAILTISLQGAPLLSQAMAATFLEPGSMGRIRTLESTLSLFVLLAGLGAPSLAVREVAATVDPLARPRVVRSLALLPTIGALAILAVAWLLALEGTVTTDTFVFVLASIALVWLISFNRFMGGLAQGLGEVRLVWLPLMTASAAAIGLNLIGAWFGSFHGWIAGRYAGEMLILAAFLIALRGTAGVALGSFEINWRELGNLVGGAILLNAGLALRMATDALPLLILTLLRNEPADAGQLGVATLILTMALLPVAIFNQAALPQMARAHVLAPGKGDKQSLARTSAWIGIFVALPTATGAQLLTMILPAEYHQGFDLASLLAVAIPLKSIASAYGTELLAAGRYRAPVIANLTECLVVAALCMSASSLWGLAFAIIAGAAVSVSCLALAVRHPIAARSS